MGSHCSWQPSTCLQMAVLAADIDHCMPDRSLKPADLFAHHDLNSHTSLCTSASPSHDRNPPLSPSHGSLSLAANTRDPCVQQPARCRESCTRRSGLCAPCRPRSNGMLLLFDTMCPSWVEVWTKRIVVFSSNPRQCWTLHAPR